MQDKPVPEEAPFRMTTAEMLAHTRVTLRRIHAETELSEPERTAVARTITVLDRLSTLVGE